MSLLLFVGTVQYRTYTEKLRVTGSSLYFIQLTDRSRPARRRSDERDTQLTRWGCVAHMCARIRPPGILLHSQPIQPRSRCFTPYRDPILLSPIPKPPTATGRYDARVHVTRYSQGTRRGGSGGTLLQPRSAAHTDHWPPWLAHALAALLCCCSCAVCRCLSIRRAAGYASPPAGTLSVGSSVGRAAAWLGRSCGGRA